MAAPYAVRISTGNVGLAIGYSVYAVLGAYVGGWIVSMECTWSYAAPAAGGNFIDIYTGNATPGTTNETLGRFDCDTLVIAQTFGQIRYDSVLVPGLEIKSAFQYIQINNGAKNPTDIFVTLTVLPPA